MFIQGQGPSPMIAAFWDDLKTGSGGDILYITDDYVVIRWIYENIWQ